MRPIRSIAAAFGAAAVLAAGPAAAQSAAELLGVYHMSILTKSGPECPAEDDEDLSIEIRRIAGARMMFGEPGKDDEEVAEFDPAARTFRFEEAGSDSPGVFTGRFTRIPDAVRLDMTVQIPGCTGTFAGYRPAPGMPASTAPVPGAQSPGGQPPGGQAPGAASSDNFLNPESISGDPGEPTPEVMARRPLTTGEMALYGAWALGLVAALVGFWFFMRRRKAPEPAPPPQDPPA